LEEEDAAVTVGADAAVDVGVDAAVDRETVRRKDGPLSPSLDVS
jgi:hypothetical protein